MIKDQPGVIEAWAFQPKPGQADASLNALFLGDDFKIKHLLLFGSKRSVKGVYCLL